MVVVVVVVVVMVVVMVVVVMMMMMMIVLKRGWLGFRTSLGHLSGPLPDLLRL